ncbi:hypothetical protein GIB67_020404 [Kingdonia uniflora]|uniref:Peptidase M3A/M3B catalytic domain-containing protein n=1 Tax=Kingdonia uniflora TaxID=39325 RepID=A0A7J7NVX0_9MAGN|nr:hypothetical protein GIB67_020404 [Kingdonia uniflora]
MGHRSFADFAVHLNLASSPDVINSFLLELNKIVRSKADEVISYYFPISQCIEGLKVLVQSLFGATFHSIPLVPGESWHEDVLKMLLHHPKEGDLGYLYLDLYSRKDKYPSCAHFEIKDGRRLSETKYQLHIVALVCNFSAPFDSSTTRYYAWNCRFLRTFAKHNLIGEVIPEEVMELMKGARNPWHRANTEFLYDSEIMDIVVHAALREYCCVFNGKKKREILCAS